MDIWFARCNGETGHNRPGTALYVPGEPPAWPAREFNYKHECIVGGFARVGMPGSGDLRSSAWKENARRAYPHISEDQIRYLDQFASVRVGDLMLIPAYREKGDVRIGVVVAPPSDRCPAFDGVRAYHYYYNIQEGDWYENAHRVSVRWSGQFATLSCLGRVWLKAFGQVVKGAGEVLQAAAERELIALR